MVPADMPKLVDSRRGTRRGIFYKMADENGVQNDAVLTGSAVFGLK